MYLNGATVSVSAERIGEVLLLLGVYANLDRHSKRHRASLGPHLGRRRFGHVLHERVSRTQSAAHVLRS